jgi:uncharacterized repeat protein (TIGR01451 family)
MIITKTITVTNTGGAASNVKVTITLSSGVTISSFQPDKGTLSGNIWTIPQMYDGETTNAKINLSVPQGQNSKMNVKVFGIDNEVYLVDNFGEMEMNLPKESCAPPNVHCGQPTVSLLDDVLFGMVSGNMAANSCLSSHCRHRFSISDLENLDSNSISFDKTDGTFSLQPVNPFKPWSFDFRVKSYDCTVNIKGKTKFEADGPKTVSGPALYNQEDILSIITDDIKTYSTNEDADNDNALLSGEWFVVIDEDFPSQGSLNIKI